MNPTYTLYKIYYSGIGREYVACLGRTKQRINSRLRGHFFAAAMHKQLDIFCISKIEIAECQTEADMFLYEIYYINKFKPTLNRDDKARDKLTISLKELEFYNHDCSTLMDKWKREKKSSEKAEKTV